MAKIHRIFAENNRFVSWGKPYCGHIGKSGWEMPFSGRMCRCSCLLLIEDVMWEKYEPVSVKLFGAVS